MQDDARGCVWVDSESKEWVKDELASACMRCTAKFSAFLWK
jgi:hypothetical protein